MTNTPARRTGTLWRLQLAVTLLTKTYAAASWRRGPRRFAAAALLLSLCAWLPVAAAQGGGEPVDVAWVVESIGAGVGEARFGADGVELSSSGYDIWHEADAFEFAYLTMDGDGEIVARVAELERRDASSKAGVMLRETLSPASRNVALLLTAERGVRMQLRMTAAAPTQELVGSQAASPVWLRLQRRGDTVIASESNDGAVWTEVGRVDLALADQLYVGLVTASHTQGSVRARFDTVRTTASSPSLADAPPLADSVGDDLPLQVVGPTLDGPPTLLKAYWVNVLAGEDGIKVSTAFMRYRPRQMAAGLDVDLRYGNRVVDDPGPYRGWDVLTTDANGTYKSYREAEFLHLELNRDARVAVVLVDGKRDALPSWLRSWRDAGDIVVWGRAQPVFETTLLAGEYDLGSLENRGDSYFVLLAEADGRPSPPPLVPAGNEAPRANATCPAWVHDRHLAEGPGGRLYRTWHPQIDPIYWCYFGHEHGSDPTLFAGYPEVQPLFNIYSHITGHNEPHEGFKVLVFEEEEHSVMFTVHGTSYDLARICTRFHAFDWSFADADTGEILADFHFKGDFGFARAAFPENRLVTLSPSACPENAAIAGTGGRRNIPVLAPGTGYESWQVDFSTAAQLPFFGGVTTAFDNPQTRLVDDSARNGGVISGDEVDYMGLGQDGSTRWFIIVGSDQGHTFGIDAGLVDHSGVFYTDYTGRFLLASDDPEAVRQYLKPGVRIQLGDEGTGKYAAEEPWRALYVLAEKLVRIDRNLEDHIPVPGRN